jgi:hypothetical protein
LNGRTASSLEFGTNFEVDWAVAYFPWGDAPVGLVQSNFLEKYYQRFNLGFYPKLKNEAFEIEDAPSEVCA